MAVAVSRIFNELDAAYARPPTPAAGWAGHELDALASRLGPTVRRSGASPGGPWLSDAINSNPTRAPSPTGQSGPAPPFPRRSRWYNNEITSNSTPPYRVQKMEMVSSTAPSAKISPTWRAWNQASISRVATMSASISSRIPTVSTKPSPLACDTFKESCRSPAGVDP